MKEKENKMSDEIKKSSWNNIPVRLSVLWIFAMFNYLYADVMTLMDPPVLNQILNGSAGGMQINAMFLFWAAVLMETAMLMIPVSLFAPYPVSRWSNVAAGVLHTAAVGGSMFVGTSPAPYYIFCGAVEMICTVYIVITALRWKKNR